MKVNVFTIRLAPEQFAGDQKVLNDFLETIDFIKSDVHFIEGEADYWSVMIHFEEKKDKAKAEQKSEAIREENLNAKQLGIYTALKKWRTQKSQDWNIPSFMISRNSELLNVVVKRPKTLTELRAIKGYGELKVENHGREILAVVSNSNT